MKKLFTIISCCIFAASVQAQIVSSHSRSITTEKANYPDYNRIELSYAPMSTSEKDDDDFDLNLTGIKFGYLQGTSISQSMPLYVEYGINAMYAWTTESEKHWDETVSFLNLNVPVNIAYKYAINEEVSITPYAGLHLRGNIIGQLKEEYTGNDSYYKEDNSTVNFFDKDDMGKDYTANRIQVGAQVGVGLDYKNIHVGVGYDTQFGEYMKNVSTSGYSITVGLNL